MTNKKVASEVAIGIILLIAVVVGGIFWMQSRNSVTSNQELVTNKVEIQKPAEEKTWHIEGDDKYVDEQFGFSAIYPKGWFVKEDLPVGPNKGGWVREIWFSNYNFDNNFNIDNFPKDFQVFDFIMVDKDKCLVYEKNGVEITSDLVEWKKSFDNIAVFSKEYPQLSATKTLKIDNYCLHVETLFPENVGSEVNINNRIEIIKNFGDSFQFFSGIVCTQDAKLCDDGSYVSRTGPKCEFSACPTLNEDGDQSIEFKFEAPANWQIYKNDKYAFELKYPKGWAAKIEQWEDMPGEDSGRLGFIYIGKAPISEKKEISGDIWKNGYPLEELKNPGPVISSKEIVWKREGIRIIEIDSVGQDINGDYEIRNFILYSDKSSIIRLGCEKKDVEICTNIVSTLKFVE